jgi:hypothetical protein
MNESCVGHLAYLGEKREAYKIFVKNLKERERLEDPDIDRGLYLNERAWTGLIWYKIGTTDGCCEKGNENSGSK